VGKTSHTVGDTSKVTINDYRELYRPMRFQLAPRSITLDNLELL